MDPRFSIRVPPIQQQEQPQQSQEPTQEQQQKPVEIKTIELKSVNIIPVEKMVRPTTKVNIVRHHTEEYLNLGNDEPASNTPENNNQGIKVVPVQVQQVQVQQIQPKQVQQVQIQQVQVQKLQVQQVQVQQVGAPDQSKHKFSNTMPQKGLQPGRGRGGPLGAGRGSRPNQPNSNQGMSKNQFQRGSQMKSISQPSLVDNIATNTINNTSLPSEEKKSPRHKQQENPSYQSSPSLPSVPKVVQPGAGQQQGQGSIQLVAGQQSERAPLANTGQSGGRQPPGNRPGPTKNKIMVKRSDRITQVPAGGNFDNNTFPTKRGRVIIQQEDDTFKDIKGEEIKWTREMVDYYFEDNYYEGVFYITNYRLLFFPKAKPPPTFPTDHHFDEKFQVKDGIPDHFIIRDYFIQIPLVTIVKVDKLTKKLKGMDTKLIEITSHLTRKLIFSFRSCKSERLEFFKQLKQVVPWKLDQLFAFSLASPVAIPRRHDSITEFDNFVQDIMNKGILRWRVTTENIEYDLCDTYPGRLIVPADINDMQLKAAAAFRIHKRFPAVSWIYKQNGSALIRSSFPTLDRCVEDEQLLAAYGNANPTSAIIYVYDTRSKAQTLVDAARGLSIENTNYYADVRLFHLDLFKSNDLRESWWKLHELITTNDRNCRNWYALLDQTKWLYHIRDLISSACTIAGTLEKGNSALIHCRSGWDHTPQLCSLVQIILSPKARTIRGFQNLIEREWISFGFPFSSCSAHYYYPPENDIQHESFSKDTTKAAPYFILFLDCVYQLLQNFPQSFDFNSEFLVTLAEAAYSGVFGNFIGDCESERIRHNVDAKTTSIWESIFQNSKFYQNPFFTNSNFTLPNLYMHQIRLWTQLYFKWNIESQDTTLLLEQAHFTLLNENFELHSTIKRSGLQQKKV